MDNNNNGEKVNIAKYIDRSTVLGFVGTIVGAIASVFAAIKTEANGFVTVFVLSIVMEVVILLMWTLCLYEKFRHKIKEDELNDRIKAS